MENNKFEYNPNFLKSAIFSLGYLFLILLLTSFTSSDTKTPDKSKSEYKLLYRIYNESTMYSLEKIVDLPYGTRQFLGIEIPLGTSRMDVINNCQPEYVDDFTLNLINDRSQSFQRDSSEDLNSSYVLKGIEVYSQKSSNEYFIYDFANNTRTPVECNKKFSILNREMYGSPDGKINLYPNYSGDTYNYIEEEEADEYELVFPYLGRKYNVTTTVVPTIYNQFFINGEYVDYNKSNIIFNPYFFDENPLNTFTIVGWVK